MEPPFLNLGVSFGSTIDEHALTKRFSRLRDHRQRNVGRQEAKGLQRRLVGHPYIPSVVCLIASLSLSL